MGGLSGSAAVYDEGEPVEGGKGQQEMTTVIRSPISKGALRSERTAKHSARADELLQHAERIMAKNASTAPGKLSATDRLQVSENIWGSVSHTLKAIAATRGWVYHSRSAQDNMESYLSNLLPLEERGELNQSLNAVEQMHNNFYDDPVREGRLVGMVQVARGLNAQLWQLAGSIPPEAEAPEALHRYDNPRALRDSERRVGRVQEPPTRNSG